MSYKTGAISKQGFMAILLDVRRYTLRNDNTTTEMAREAVAKERYWPSWADLEAQVTSIDRPAKITTERIKSLREYATNLGKEHGVLLPHMLKLVAIREGYKDWKALKAARNDAVIQVIQDTTAFPRIGARYVMVQLPGTEVRVPIHISSWFSLRHYHPAHAGTYMLRHERFVNDETPIVAEWDGQAWYLPHHDMFVVKMVDPSRWEFCGMAQPMQPVSATVTH